MHGRTAPVGIALVAALVISAPARAQQQEPLSAVVLKLMLSDIFLAPPAVAGVPDHSAHFVSITPTAELVEGYSMEDIAIPLMLNSTVVSQLGTFPLGPSSGGFTWQYDAALGTFTRTTQSFGPSFAERALTTGKGRWNFGMNYVHASYRDFEGKSLENGDVQVFLHHSHEAQDGQPAPFYEGDVIRNALMLDLTSDTFAFAANYGLTDRLDLGITVPVVRVSLDATVRATIERLATAAIPAIHRFPDGSSERLFRSSGTASGIGDMVIRGKYNFLKRAGLGLAGAVDLRLPTGDEANLLGSGGTQTRVYMVVSGTAGRIAPHVNLGYTFGHSGADRKLYIPEVADEVGYTFGFDAVVSPRVTLAADLVGRSLRNFGRLTDGQRTFTFVNQAGVPGTAQFDEFAYQPTGSLNLALAAFGGRVNVWGNMLVTAQVLFPVSSSGLRPRPMPIIGVDYSF